MSEHRAAISWILGPHDFETQSYPRDHTWRLAGGVEIPASAAPDYRGDPERVDPEEAFVASLASCHMLTFLALAARKRLVVERYEDDAVGTMDKNEEGRLAITRVLLRPRICFGGDRQPSAQDVARIHDQAHEHCFIANSVKTEIRLEPE